MKKILTSACIIALWAMSPLFAQINIGLKAGANYNFNTHSSDSLNLSLGNAASFSGGGLVRVKIKRLSIQGEGLFVGRNGEAKSNGKKEVIKFYSFDLPLLLGYALIDAKVIKLRVNAGVIPSFKIASFGDLEKANFEDSFYSAAAGISLDIPLFLFDIRYQGGIGNYYEVKSVNATTQFTNSMVTFSVAWKII